MFAKITIDSMRHKTQVATNGGRCNRQLLCHGGRNDVIVGPKITYVHTTMSCQWFINVIHLVLAQ